VKPNGQGREKLSDGYNIIWSGKTTEKINGAAIIVNPPYAEMVTETECIQEE
jgi:hypothetical protein